MLLFISYVSLSSSFAVFHYEFGFHLLDFINIMLLTLHVINFIFSSGSAVMEL